MKKDNKTIVNKIIPDFNPNNQSFSGAGSAYSHNIVINNKEILPWPHNNKIEGGITLPLDYQDDNQITNKPVIPHDAIGQYANNQPFDPNIDGLHQDWLLFRYKSDYSTYALWFKTKNNTPIRVLTNWDLFNDNNINCVKFTANENSSIEVSIIGTEIYNTQLMVFNDKYTQLI